MHRPRRHSSIDQAAATQSVQPADENQGTPEQISEALDLTLLSWARALELKYGESEGHTLDLAEMAVKLATALGVDEAQLIHVYRGALLHDVGKMLIPDNILNKTTTLSAEEWGIIQKHPLYAFGMLQNVHYLRPALDIPYCHHERWDGSGYPRGLKGEQIPLAARVFAVVDMRDALMSRRPFREPWENEVVDAFIESLAGTHFDPQVVAVFMQLMKAKP